MADIVIFDGCRKRVSAATANRYNPQNRAEIARREKIGLNEVERLVRENSRPIDIKPLALDWRLRRAA